MICSRRFRIPETVSIQSDRGVGWGLQHTQMTLPTIIWGMENAVAWIAEPTTTRASPINMQPRRPRGIPMKNTNADTTVAASTYEEATIGISYVRCGFCCFVSHLCPRLLAAPDSLRLHLGKASCSEPRPKLQHHNRREQMPMESQLVVFAGRC